MLQPQESQQRAAAPAAIDPAQITGVVLAGGRGARMGGVDKGLQLLGGVALAQHALRRLQSQVGATMVNANRHQDQYAAFGAPVFADVLPDYAGPLAGFITAMQNCATPYLVTVPCDSPRFPADLVARLALALVREKAQIAMASAPEPDASGALVLRSQPVFCLLRTDLLPSLAQFTTQGGRKIDAWTAGHRTVMVPFDDVAAFANANTTAQLQALQPGAAMTPTVDEIAAELQGYDPKSLRATDVLRFLERLVQPLDEVEQVGVFDALGRVLARDVVSPIDVPAHDNSAMDGFAFDGAILNRQGPVQLRVVGTALAGQPWQGPLGAGEALKVMTGAVLPAGLDTVVPQEMVQTDGASINFDARSLKPGDNRRELGEDLKQGLPALHQGDVLGPAALGLIASLGIAQVPVFRKLRVATFSTGNEILSLGDAPRAGAVYDSNRYTVFGLLSRLGVEVLDLGVVRDEPVELEAAFRRAAGLADAIITSGGVSVGEADYTKAMMHKLAGSSGGVAFWRIAMRPGRPMAVGRIASATPSGTRSALLFGLPGNPVAVMVTFLAFVRPALLRMMGASARELPLLRAHSAEAMRKKPGRTEYQRGVVSRAADGRLQVRSTGNQGSGVLRSMVQANGLIVLAHDQGNVAIGDAVDVMMFDGVV